MVVLVVLRVRVRAQRAINGFSITPINLSGTCYM